MKKTDLLFMEALKASIKGEDVNWSAEELTEDELFQLFRIADIHNVLPMIYEATYQSPAMLQLPQQYSRMLRGNAIHSVALQAMKTAEFQNISDHLRKAGILPCVVKGVICRNLYKNPDGRLSGDEDIFIPEDQFQLTHQAFLEYGITLSIPDKDVEKEHELAYGLPGSPIYLELHKHLFPPESQAYGDLNRFFDGVHSRTDGIHKGTCGLIEEEINGTKFLTLNHTDHLLYLILHSFKHFLHSGFGIRQVCDIYLYAEAYGSDIDWDYVLTCLQEVRADLFAAAMFKIGEKYLTFDSIKAAYPDSWKSIDVDENGMLDDLLASGVYGQSDLSRKHSSNITLNAIIADKRGEKASSGKLQSAIRSVCLPIESLSDRYSYLKKYPVLLPVAWTQRVLTYMNETKDRQGDNNASDSIKIGTERVELLRKYGIIK